MIKYIANEDHYNEIISRVLEVQKCLWIGTADIKDLYAGGRPFLGLIAELVLKGKEIRLLHAKKPGLRFKEDFNHYPVLYTGLERTLCPRVHLKLFIFDLKVAYIGSANLTGAGLGMKGKDKRNFEAGILTDDQELVSQAVMQFDEIWMGKHCSSCRRKNYCPSPIM